MKNLAPEVFPLAQGLLMSEAQPLLAFAFFRLEFFVDFFQASADPALCAFMLAVGNGVAVDKLGHQFRRLKFVITKILHLYKSNKTLIGVLLCFVIFL